MWVCCRRASERCSRPGAGRHLEDDRPVGQGRLAGQEDAAVRAAAQLGQQAKARPASRRPPGRRRGPAVRRAGWWQSSRTSSSSRHCGKRPGTRPGRPPRRLLAQADLLVDQFEGGLGLRPATPGGGPGTPRRQRSLAASPARGHLVGQPLRNGIDASGRGRRARPRPKRGRSRARGLVVGAARVIAHRFERQLAGQVAEDAADAALVQAGAGGDLRRATALAASAAAARGAPAGTAPAAAPTARRPGPARWAPAAPTPAVLASSLGQRLLLQAR